MNVKIAEMLLDCAKKEKVHGDSQQMYPTVCVVTTHD